MAERERSFLPTAYLYYQDPIQLVRAQGCHVWDSEGNEYLDAIGGIVSISSGHNHPKIKEQLLEMLKSDEIQHTSMLYLSRYPVELAKKLKSLAPSKLSRVAMTNSGSEANELAMMAARQATGETIVVNLRHGYHGGTSGALASCGHASWRFRSQPNSQTVAATEPYCYRCPFGKKRESCNLECASHVEDIIQTATHGKIAAMIVEPIMGVGGFIDAPKEYFVEVAKIVHQYGGKYISDEVQTGVGRCGEDFFHTQALGIDADCITMAKGLGNGAAAGAVLMTDDVSASLAGKFHFNTFGGDPYQSAQASCNIDIILEEKLIENAKTQGARLKTGLQELQKKHEIIGDVRGQGLLLGVELVKDKASKEHHPEAAGKMMETCKVRGLLIGKGGLKGNVLRLAPPMSIVESQVDRMLEILDQSFAACSKK